MRTTWRAPASSVTFACRRLSARSSAIACSAVDAARGRAEPVRAGDGEHAGAALHAADAHGVLEVPGGLGGQQQRQPALDRGLDGLAEVHHGARLRVMLVTGRGAEPSAAELARRERHHAQFQFASPVPVRALVAAPVHEQPAPAVALVPRGARD